MKPSTTTRRSTARALAVQNRAGEPEAVPRQQPAVTPDTAAENPDAKLAKRTRKTMDYARAAATLMMFSKRSRLEFAEVGTVFRERISQIASGDMSAVESMLLTEAMTLEAVYLDLAVRASEASDVHTMDFLLRLGLKAQSQCRATLQTIGELRNPRQVAFVKQANIAHGQQQVNNGPDGAPLSPARAGKSPPLENELLGARGGLDV